MEHLHLQLALSTGSSFLACGDLSQPGQAYSAEEKLNASAVDRMVSGLAPHLVVGSLRRMLLLVLTFAFVFSMWTLYDKHRSNVFTLMYYDKKITKALDLKKGMLCAGSETGKLWLNYQRIISVAQELIKADCTGS